MIVFDIWLTRKKTDILIARLLREAGIDAEPNGSRIKEVQEALATSSKRGTGKQGFPEFTAQVGEFIIVVEDKAENERQAKYISPGSEVLLMDNSSIVNYAENGALHYAQNIIAKTTFKKVFAFGCSGTTEKTLKIRPIFVTPNGYKVLKFVPDFKKFSPDKIRGFYEIDVLAHKTPEQKELEDILSRAEKLNEDLHIYGSLSNLEKPVAVSAILLALQNTDFSTEDLTCDDERTDGHNYQPSKMALDSHVTALVPKTAMSKHTMLFIARSISMQRSLFGHGRSINSARLRVFRLMLPVDETNKPDFNYMETYMKDVERRLLEQYKAYLLTTSELEQIFGG